QDLLQAELLEQEEAHVAQIGAVSIDSLGHEAPPRAGAMNEPSFMRRTPGNAPRQGASGAPGRAVAYYSLPARESGRASPVEAPARTAPDAHASRPIVLRSRWRRRLRPRGRPRGRPPTRRTTAGQAARRLPDLEGDRDL